MPKSGLWDKKVFYNFMTCNDIISRVVWKKKQYIYRKIWNLQKIILLIILYVIEYFLTVASYQFSQNC